MTESSIDEPEQELFQPVRPIRVGRYELHHKLGSGGMASVFLGRQVGQGGFERWVAVKRIHEHLAENPEFRSMFVDEARLSANLNHPNVVQVTDVGVEDKSPFIVMEYVNGETLSQLMKRCVASSRPLTPVLAARIVAYACDGLHHAHELKDSAGRPLGLVHRDVSPQNILVSYDGAVKLTDFGIAKAAGRFTHTRTGHFKGKIGYLSPEQARAQPLNRRSDVFAMGTVLWEASLSRRLFRADSELETLRRIASSEVLPPCAVDPGYPAELERIVMKALAARPDDRYQTARELQVELERYLAALGRPVGSVELADLMRAVFEDRYTARSALVTMAPGTGLELDLSTTPSASSTSLSVDPLKPTRDLGPTTELRPTSGRGGRRLALSGGLVIVALALAALAFFLFGSGDRPRVEPDVGEPAPVRVAAVSPAIGPDGAPEDRTPGSNAAPVIGPDGAPEDRTPGPRAAGDAGAATANETDAGPAVAVPPAKRAPRTVASRPPAVPSDQRIGTVSVITNPWCEVYLGNRRLGRTPLMRVELPAGRHVLRLCPLGREPCRSRAVRVVAGESTPVSVNLNP